MDGEDSVPVNVAADRLGVHPSRVRQLLASGQLHGQRVGNSWLISSADVATRAEQRPRPGRPLAPARVWGLLDLLDGGHAPWLSPVARSQVRGVLRALSGADERHWRAALRGRAAHLRLRVHPAAARRIAEHPAALPAGPERATAAGIDLVALQAPTELYLPETDWPALAARYRLRSVRAGAAEANLVVHLPKGLWPFQGGQHIGPAALAADLLDSPEPRARSGGLNRLNELAADVRPPRAPSERR